MIVICTTDSITHFKIRIFKIGYLKNAVRNQDNSHLYCKLKLTHNVSY